ncbi:MAG: DUF4416 family protein [Sphaerochaetaceae bacterium]|nr:DUF4416 family protein [Sphaerochaetaceae bacterium]MDD3163728.1 DUF4416 family protein [Sphaerochaetaceae bacterium]MDD4006708.1 DUF4416 family protein [Sphaerochaetaceae bacterium]MDD4396343.1 DUF4416 family protein [Sphaerochaetaceae bacterium]
MGKILPFEKRLLVIGVLSVLEDDDPVIADLESVWGPVRKRTGAVPFAFTDYYNPEMGSRPMRYFLVFSDLVNPSCLAEIKIKTNSIEDRYAVSGQRRINLDPGLLDLGSLILATTKDSAHRIPLSDGIYAETTLIYHTHSFHPLDWTYADYASPAFLKLFASLREEYKKQIRR